MFNILHRHRIICKEFVNFEECIQMSIEQFILFISI